MGDFEWTVAREYDSTTRTVATELVSEMQEVEAKTAKEFIDLLRPTNPGWLSNQALYSNWGFRGQGDAAWGLLPSAWRESGRELLKPSIEFNRKIGAKFKLNELQLVAHCQYHAEDHVVQKFAEIADRVGLSIPEFDVLLRRDEDGEPIRPNWNCEQANLPGIFAIAQHHGVPTPLLDFTGHGLIAAFFAAESADRLVARSNQSAISPLSHLAVWAINWRHTHDHRV